LNYRDSSRRRQEVAFFPTTTAANAPPGGINLPAITSTTRDNVPGAFKTPGTVIFQQHHQRAELLERDGVEGGDEQEPMSGGARAAPSGFLARRRRSRLGEFDPRSELKLYSCSS
jgi:hypothetical protein